MSTEIKENDDSTSPKKIALKLRQRGRNVISPIDLSVEMAEPLHAGELQWINFYEPPIKLMMKNSGDTVMIQGRWSHQRPTLSGGPLDGLYVFNQMHFHWDSPTHERNRHTINTKPICLEMHVLFYKSSYQSLAEAQDKEDGVLIVVYLFKVENRSSFKWMTDQLEDVKSIKTTTQLPPAPLCSLMVPFTKDYLVYWGALPCTCHHVLWMVSRTTLRISREELAKFDTLQSDSREKIYNTGLETVESTRKTYQINSSSENKELLFPNPVDPPCQITTKPDKISIAVAYQLENAKNITDKNALETLHGDLVPKSTFQEKCISVSNENSSNTQRLCSLCKVSAVVADYFGRSHHIFPRKRCIFVLKRNIFKKEKIANAKKIKILEKEREKYHKKAKHLYLERKKSATAKRLSEGERRSMFSMKEAFNEEIKKLSVSKEHELKETTPEGNSGVTNCCPKQLKSPVNKSVLTKKPNPVPGNLNKLKSEKESLETNSTSFSKKESGLKSGTIKDNGTVKDKKDNNEKVNGPVKDKRDNNEKVNGPVKDQKDNNEKVNGPAKDKRDNNEKVNGPVKDQKGNNEKVNGPVKDKKDNKEKVEKLKSKHSIMKFTPYRPRGLQSSLTPYFQSCKPKQASETRPKTVEINVKTTSQIPKRNKSNASGSVNQPQDLQGKGDHHIYNPKRIHIKVMDHVLGTGINFL